MVISSSDLALRAYVSFDHRLADQSWFQREGEEFLHRNVPPQDTTGDVELRERHQNRDQATDLILNIGKTGWEIDRKYD